MAPSRASICRACWCCLPLAQWAGEHGLPALTHKDAVSKSRPVSRAHPQSCELFMQRGLPLPDRKPRAGRAARHWHVAAWSWVPPTFPSMRQTVTPTFWRLPVTQMKPSPPAAMQLVLCMLQLSVPHLVSIKAPQLHHAARATTVFLKGLFALPLCTFPIGVPGAVQSAVAASHLSIGALGGCGPPICYGSSADSALCLCRTPTIGLPPYVIASKITVHL